MRANVYNFIENFKSVKQMAMTDWLMHEKHGKFWKGGDQEIKKKA